MTGELRQETLDKTARKASNKDRIILKSDLSRKRPKSFLFRSSTMVVRHPVKVDVVGSSPTSGVLFSGGYLNG